MIQLGAGLLALLLLTAASAPVGQQGVSLDDQLKQSRSEEAAAEAETARLEKVAGKARDEVDRLRGQAAAAAEALEAAEARITAADARLGIASSYVAEHHRQLAEQQQPISSLLTGLATMSRRPPLLAIADDRSVDELVRIRILLDSTVPVIRARTSKLAAGSTKVSGWSRMPPAPGQSLLAARRTSAPNAGNLQSSSSGRSRLQLPQTVRRSALAMRNWWPAENVEQLTGAEQGSRSALTIAAQLANLDSAPARPGQPDETAPHPPFAYQLPATAGVTEGLEEVNASGVRSRGLTLATLRGASVVAPAPGVVKFAGPYGNYDGILIIDHGGGWMSLIVNVSSELKTGERVEAGQAIGRALGPLQVELSQYGRRISPALIAGSSQSLSNNFKGG